MPHVGLLCGVATCTLRELSCTAGGVQSVTHEKVMMMVDWAVATQN
ncbi:MAG: hypothetical protein LBQ02_03170 [Candidatus Nomurabacteria bacterium]|nr:hypothetical protein [Candidatus Nomurabacteria bacterium]